ncbi:MAG: sulfite exporter TauE/SafE family protein [Deltaproteobacteria bacterium]|nr:sulfite exporter TauE/SafE family protein [Deltaproteobacteria bacterium]
MESFGALLPSVSASQEPLLIALLMMGAFAGAFITSGFGIGGGVVMTPLFIMLLPAKIGVGLGAPLMLLISGTAVRQYWRQWNRRNLLVLLPSCLAGIWLGSYLLAAVSGETVRKTVGVLALGFGFIQLIIIDRPDLRIRFRPPEWQGVFFGLGSGITTALAHTGGIVFSFYLFPNSPTKESFVATTVFLFFSSGLVKIGTYWYYDILTIPILIASLALVPSLIAGSIAGKWLNRRLSNKLFMRLIPLIAAAMGIKLILG